MFTGEKSVLNLSIGSFLILSGVIEILGEVGWLPFSVPDIPSVAIAIILSVIGFYAIIDSVMVFLVHPTIAIIDFLMGLFLLLFGLVPVLNYFTALQIPIEFVSMIVISPIIIIIGIILIITSWNF